MLNRACGASQYGLFIASRRNPCPNRRHRSSKGKVTMSNGSASLIARAKAMILQPKSEWQVVATESDSAQGIFMRYVVPLAAIGPIAGFIGMQVFGFQAFGVSFKPSLMAGLTQAIVSYVLALVAIWVVTFIIDALAPSFGGTSDRTQAMKLAAYAGTAGYLGGIFGLVPAIALLGLLASLYGLYLLYLGATPVMKVPQDRAVVFVIIIIVATIAAYVVMGMITSAITAPMMAPPAVTIS
jgi:hypothetical protein